MILELLENQMIFQTPVSRKRSPGDKNLKNSVLQKTRKIAIADPLGGMTFKTNNFSIISFHRFFNRILTMKIQ